MDKKRTVDMVNGIATDLSHLKINDKEKIIERVAILGRHAYNTTGNIFREFTDQALDSACGVFENCIARLDHDRNATFDNPRGVKTGYGVYQNVRREGDMIYGDLHLWDCPEADKVLSIAQNTPNAVGNSIHAGGIVVEDEETGMETCIQLLSRTEQQLKSSVDLVEDPAATTGIYQNRVKKVVKQSKENPEMDWTKATLEALKVNRPDIYQSVIDAGMAKGKEEAEKTLQPKIDELTQARDKAVSEADTLKAKNARTVQQATANKLLSESELPDCAKTEVFMSQLIAVKETKKDGNTVTIEEGMKALIQDRMVATSPDGVIDNPGKHTSLSQDKKGADGLASIISG